VRRRRRPAARRRSAAHWRATLISEGMVIVRHPEPSKTIEIADLFADMPLFAA